MSTLFNTTDIHWSATALITLLLRNALWDPDSPVDVTLTHTLLQAIALIAPNFICSYNFIFISFEMFYFQFRCVSGRVLLFFSVHCSVWIISSQQYNNTIKKMQTHSRCHIDVPWSVNICIIALLACGCLQISINWQTPKPKTIHADLYYILLYLCSILSGFCFYFNFQANLQMTATLFDCISLL